MADLVAEIGEELPAEALKGENWSLISAKAFEIIQKLENVSDKLSEFLDKKINYGIKTGFNEAFIVDKETRDRLISGDKKSVEILKPIIAGENAKRYGIDFQDKYLIWTYIGVEIDKYPSIKRHLEKYQEKLEKRWDKGNYWWELRACDYYGDFEKPKIVLPDIAIDCRFAFDSDNLFMANTGYIIPIDNLYVLSTLNSKVTHFFYKGISPTYRGGYLRFIYQHLVQIPIRRISFTTPEEERARLVSELKELYAESNFPGIILRVESYLPKDAEGNFITEKEKSDVIHDLLGFLAEQMMDLNKQKQAEIKGFLAWLENYLGIKIDEMNVKTQVKAFYDRGWDEYYKVLKRSKGKLELKIEGKDAHDTIKEAFDGTMSKLTPLFDRIRKTDELIDQIVYRLYGLTEEEIKVVEGNA